MTGGDCLALEVAITSPSVARVTPTPVPQYLHCTYMSGGPTLGGVTGPKSEVGLAPRLRGLWGMPAQAMLYNWAPSGFCPLSLYPF